MTTNPYTNSGVQRLTTYRHATPFTLPSEYRCVQKTFCYKTHSHLCLYRNICDYCLSNFTSLITTTTTTNVEYSWLVVYENNDHSQESPVMINTARLSFALCRHIAYVPMTVFACSFRGILNRGLAHRHKSPHPPVIETFQMPWPCRSRQPETLCQRQALSLR